MFLFKRKPKPAIEDEAIAGEAAPAQSIAAELTEPAKEPEPVRRVRQQNIKASEDCCAHFDALAKALGMTKAELFEDMVVERYEALQRQGIQIETV